MHSKHRNTRHDTNRVIYTRSSGTWESRQLLSGPNKIAHPVSECHLPEMDIEFLANTAAHGGCPEVSRTKGNVLFSVRFPPRRSYSGRRCTRSFSLHIWRSSASLSVRGVSHGAELRVPLFVDSTHESSALSDGLELRRLIVLMWDDDNIPSTSIFRAVLSASFVALRGRAATTFTTSENPYFFVHTTEWDERP